MISFPNKQRGVVLFVAMIALVVLMIAAVSLIRSTDTAQLIAGNLAIKRDMTHESQQALEAAIANFYVGGALGAEVAREADVASVNYSSTALPTNSYGIPTTLLQASTASETAAYSASGVTYRYVIDRMCPLTGVANSPTAHCIVDSPDGPAIDAFNPLHSGQTPSPSAPKPVVYRISVRLTDPKKTQSFFQTTLSSRGT